MAITRKTILFTGAAVIIGGGIVAAVLLRDTGPIVEPVENIKEVSVASVGELSRISSPLPLIGTVQSRSEAFIRTEAQGEVTAVYKQLGDGIAAGETIAEISNASQRATVLQAQGAVDAARAALSKAENGATGGDRVVLEASVGDAQTSLEETRQAAYNTIFDAFEKSEDAVHNRVDQLFDNPRTTPSLVFVVPNAQLATDLPWNRTLVEPMLVAWQASLETLSPEGDLEGELEEARQRVESIRSLVNDATSAVNTLTAGATVSQTTIDSWKLELASARASIATAAANISAAKRSLTAAQTALVSARQNLEEGVTGSRDEDLAALEASVTQARGGLAGALAALEKTIIRSPISGTLNNITIRKGDYVSSFEPAAVVANNGAFEIQTFVSESDRNEIAVGNSARIGGRYQGAVTAIGSGIDSQTKKIEVRIGLTEPGDAELVHADTVRVDVDRTALATDQAARIAIPLSAIKIETDAAYVFTVAADGTLMGQRVELGSLLGEKVIIRSGLTLDMQIVTDARGLQEGQHVSL